MPHTHTHNTYLLPSDGHVILDVPKHSGLDEVAPVRCHGSPTHQFGTLSLPSANVAQNLLELLLIHLRSEGDGSISMYSCILQYTIV